MGIIGRLLLLLAVLLMPVGMEPAASAPMASHHIMMTTTAMERCPDQSGEHQHNNGLAMCSMACASALPAQELVRGEAPIRRPELVTAMTVQALDGIHPETATPPPKLA